MLVKLTKDVLRRFGYRLTKLTVEEADPRFHHIVSQVRPYTMTTEAAMWSLYQAVLHVIRHDIPGAIVECGVWRGGSMMFCALTLKALGHTNRRLYLFDTFAGMSTPTGHDTTVLGEDAGKLFARNQRDGYVDWCYSSQEEVRTNLGRTGYPMQNIEFVRGKVEDTLPEKAPDRIGILRLDTDFYESTYHELTHLYPRLSVNGALILDDYGYWHGAKKAVDQYFVEQNLPVFLHRIDEGSRMIIKP
jgi:hypothetical protein